MLKTMGGLKKKKIHSVEENSHFSQQIPGRVFTHAQLDPPEPTSWPTCANVQINRKTSGAWTKATLVTQKKLYISQKAEALWCSSNKRNKPLIHKNKKGTPVIRYSARVPYSFCSGLSVSHRFEGTLRNW